MKSKCTKVTVSLFKAYKVIISTTQQNIRLKRMTVKPNYFATFLVDQNSITKFTVGATINPINCIEKKFPTLYIVITIQ